MNSNELLLTAGGPVFNMADQTDSNSCSRAFFMTFQRASPRFPSCWSVGISAVSGRRIGRRSHPGCFSSLMPRILPLLLLLSTRGPPDISSLVPVGPKYTMKWSAPLQHVQVVEVGQEQGQSKDTLFQQSGAKRPGSACASGKSPPPHRYLD